MLEHVIADLSSQDDALRLVESPVDAEVDAALAIFFLRFGERGVII